MGRNGILAGGNFIRDYTRVIDGYPGEQTLANILDQSDSNGGSPYNVLKDLSRLGVSFPLEAVGVIGNDESGKKIIEDCQNNGIGISGLKISQNTGTSFTDVMLVKTTGKRTFFHFRGANAQLSVEHFDFENHHSKIFHLGYLLLLDNLDVIDEEGRSNASRVFEKAANSGFVTTADLVSENSDRFKSVVRPSLPWIDYLFLNEFEAEKLTGLKIDENAYLNTSLAGQAADIILDHGVRNMVIIHSPSGAVAKGKSGFYVQDSVNFPKERISGTTGAGDAFAAGVLYGIHENLPPEKYLEIGTCTAAACLTHPSCSEGIKPLRDVLALGEQYGFRNPGQK